MPWTPAVDARTSHLRARPPEPVDRELTSSERARISTLTAHIGGQEGGTPIGITELCSTSGLSRDTGAPAVVDSAHIGDITGALGTIRHHDTDHRVGLRRKLLTLLAIMGPGLVVMIGDNDVGGVSTYAQAGQNYGTSLLWTLLLLVPVLIVNQEMVARLGAVSGVGHARLIFARFGRLWGAFSVGDLMVLNFLTIVTEFIGVSLAMQHFGVSQYVSVPAMAVILLVVVTTGSFRRWERVMYISVVASLLMIPLAFMSHPQPGQIIHDALVPGVRGGLDSTVLLLIIAIVGTTVAPWQLFFQQSNVIDKRITTRWLNYERADTVIGSILVIAGAAALMITAAFAFGGTPLAGQFGDAGTVANQLSATIGPRAGDIFAIITLNAAFIGACAVTLASSYAFGDTFKVRHSLHRGATDARAFYMSYAVMILLAAGIVIMPGAPLGIMVTAVQALAGILLPSATVFLLILCNDRDVLGPWVNRAWLNAVAAVILAVLVGLSAILTISVLLPRLDAIVVAEYVAVIIAVCLLAIVLYARYRPQLTMRLFGADTPRYRHAAAAAVVSAIVPRLSGEDRAAERATWRMAPVDTLPAPGRSRVRTAGMIALRLYLIVAVGLLVVKTIQLTLGAH
jgi:Mn2+/Fe2+ NRAMP family transporter